MKLIKVIAFALSAIISAPAALSQDFVINNSNEPMGSMVSKWEVTVREMPADIRAKITEVMNLREESGKNRTIISDVLSSIGAGAVSGLVEVVVSETYNLTQIRKKQKQEWARMIQNENNYTDSISSIKGLNDFYARNSFRGALDPSDINFDGIEIRGLRDGQEMIYMSCSIDRDKIENLFSHSKFNLVVDTLAFYPYRCHLPNVTANGIRLMEEIKKSEAEVKGDAIIRPGKGGNGFSFDERKDLNIGIDLSIYSSWINEAIQVHKNVELGNFKFSFKIHDGETVNEDGTVKTTYTYSRNGILQQALTECKDDSIAQKIFLENNLIKVTGDCFVVPRSYMPLDNGKQMWGTGEYDIKIKIRESCQLDDKSDKAKNWHKDYKSLRQMQKKSGEVIEYFKTLWSQNGNSLVKELYKTGLSTAATELTDPIFNGASGSSGGMGGQSGGMGGQSGGHP